jgi:osmotically-inducible protein OsmY
MKKRLLLTLMLVAPTTLLGGCAAVVAGSAVTGVAMISDRRTTGTIIDDRMIESRSSDFFGADGAIAQQAHLNVSSYNGMVLLVGQTPTEEMRQRAFDYVSRVAKVRHVYNEVTIEDPIPSLDRTNDGLITTKVKSKLFTIKDLNSSDISVTTENGVVYLMGLLDQSTGDAVGQEVAGVSGVRKVVKLFEAPQAMGGAASK